LVDVAATVKQDGRAATVCVAKLLVRAALADLDKAEGLETVYNFARLQNREPAHVSTDDLLNTHALCLYVWLVLFK